MSNMMVYVGIAIGVAAIAAAVVYGTANQQNYVKEDAVLQGSASEGSFSSESGMGAVINKEKWHEDPFGDLAAKIRSEAESGG